MKRLLSAVREWVELRRRVADEFGFHLERSAAEQESLGLARRDAWRLAKARLGGQHHLVAARRELGADWLGLIALLAAHGVAAAPLFQPAVVLLAVTALLSVSPSVRLSVDSVLGIPLAKADREAVFISRQARNLSFRGVTPADLQAIRTMAGLSSIELYRGQHVRARLRPGARAVAIGEELRRHSGELRAIPLFDRSPVVMAPAKVICCFLLVCGLYRVRNSLRCGRSALYVVLGAASHALASLTLWAVAVQYWLAVPWLTDGMAASAFTILLFGYCGVVVAQALWWVRDVESRCPRCFERLRLALTTGAEYNTILDWATTDSICGYGHGSLRRDIWDKRFVSSRSHWNGLTHA